jgi:hypothetical protein
MGLFYQLRLFLTGYNIRESAMNPTISHLSESVGSAEQPIMERQKAKGIPLSHN